MQVFLGTVCERDGGEKSPYCSCPANAERFYDFKSPSIRSSSCILVIRALHSSHLAITKVDQVGENSGSIEGVWSNFSPRRVAR